MAWISQMRIAFGREFYFVDIIIRLEFEFPNILGWGKHLITSGKTEKFKGTTILTNLILHILWWIDN